MKTICILRKYAKRNGNVNLFKLSSNNKEILYNHFCKNLFSAVVLSDKTSGYGLMSEIDRLYFSTHNVIWE